MAEQIDGVQLVALFNRKLEKIISINEDMLNVVKKANGFSAETDQRQVVEKPKPVVITEFGTTAIMQISKLLKKNTEANAAQGGVGLGGPDLGFLGGLALLSGLAALISALFAENELLGILKLIARGGLEGVLKTLSGKISNLFPVKILAKGMEGAWKLLGKVAETFGKHVMKGLGVLVDAAKGLTPKIQKMAAEFTEAVAKKIPIFKKAITKFGVTILDSLTKFSDDILKFIKEPLDKALGMATDGIKAIGATISKVFPNLIDNILNFFTPIKTFLEKTWDNVVKIFTPIKTFFGAMVDTLGKAIGQAADIGLKAGASGAGVIGKIFGGFKNILMKTLGGTGKAAIAVLKRVPGLGLLISLYFAWLDIEAGNIRGAIFNVASGIASLFPGIGTALSILIDVTDAILRLSGVDDPEPGVEEGSSGFSFKEMFKSIGEWFMGTWVGKQIMSFVDGMKALFSGNFKEGIKLLGDQIIILPLTLLARGLGAFLDTGVGKGAVAAIGKAKDFWKSVRSYVSKSIKKGWKKLPSQMQTVLSWALPDSILESIGAKEASEAEVLASGTNIAKDVNKANKKRVDEVAKLQDNVSDGVRELKEVTEESKSAQAETMKSTKRLEGSMNDMKKSQNELMLEQIGLLKKSNENLLAVIAAINENAGGGNTVITSNNNITPPASVTTGIRDQRGDMNAAIGA